MKNLVKVPTGSAIIGKAKSSGKAGDYVGIDIAPKKKQPWYEYITPFLGIKWGAEITLIAYGWMSCSEGLRYAAGIVGVFLFLDWCQMAWCEFKRRIA